MFASELMTDARDMLNDPDGDFWSEAKLLRHVNRALRDVSTRARSIREVIYQRVAAGQSVYALPDGFLGNDMFSWFDGSEWWPLGKRRLPQVEYENNSDTGLKAWRPFFYDVWGRARRERIVAPVSAVSPDDDIFTADGHFPITSGAVGFRFANALSGVDDIRVGDVVVNMTDAAEGIVLELRKVSPGVVLVGAEPLMGGTRGDGSVAVGDVVRILSPEAAQHALRVAPPPDTSDSQGRESIWMYLSRRHRVITAHHIVDDNDRLELDVELESVALERVIYWCRREELGVRDPETVAQGVVYENEYRLASPKVRQRNREHESTWGSPSTAALRSAVELQGVTDHATVALNRYNIR